MIRLVVPGRPVPAARMTRKGKWLKDQAQRYLAYRSLVAWTAQREGVVPIPGPVRVLIRVYLHGHAGGDWDN